jgi:isoleucyl-tRNA synthetase
VFNYCVTDLSSFYFDVLKDRLYSDGVDSVSRRSAQTVLAEILKALVRIMAPILSFTADEVWQFMPESLRDGAVSVHIAGWPDIEVSAAEAGELREAYVTVLEVREAVTKALEDARNDKIVGKSQEAHVTITVQADTAHILEARGIESLAEMFIVASVSLDVRTACTVCVQITPAIGEKCPRCWSFRDLTEDGVCARCASALASQ